MKKDRCINPEIGIMYAHPEVSLAAVTLES
jgi:hypothetical protein